MIETALRLGLFVAEAEQTLDEYDDISRDTIEEMLRMVCNAHDWAQNIMRMIDWLSVFLTRRGRFQGASSSRLREFVKNYDDDVVDYLDLTREAGTG